MNKTAIKNYAIWARMQLIESCKQRAFEYGITEDGDNAMNKKTIGSRILKDQEVEQRNQLIVQIKQKGYAQVMEEAAYTWFNRFIALRFMEVNEYIPSKVRVFTDEAGAFKPEILKEAMNVDLEGIDKEKVIELLEKQDNEELYKYLLITQCNALSEGLPYMFEKISNWTELLFPANLLRDDSVVGRMVLDIPEDDWTDAVQVIGWLYQYYNTELKDETFDLLKKNVKITKERIPAATQLFTPDWIVRYMVENSLGRLWYEGHKDFDKSHWKYYLDEAEQELEVEAELAKIREEYSHIKPEEIKVIDPCMGSGHILVYAFDVLMQIYTSAGWSERDATRSIIENNLYGLDIDDRAGQLAYFAVMMKARKYSRRIMTLGLQPNVMSIKDSSFMTDELIDFVAGNDAGIKADLECIKEIFTDAKDIGSVLDVPLLGYEIIFERIKELQVILGEKYFQNEYRINAIEQLQPLLKQAMIMSQKYDVVVTNPPYMGVSGMPGELSSFAKKHYPNSKNDLFAICLEKGLNMTKPNGFASMITMESWMFLSSFEKMRNAIIKEKTIYSLVHMPYLGKGGTSLGINFGTDMAVISNTYINNYVGTYDRIAYYETDDGGVPLNFPVENEFYKKNSQNLFSIIPGTPLAYWVGEHFLEAFSGQTLNDLAIVQEGLKTGDNERFIRYWFEVAFDKTSMATGNEAKWVYHTKGGDYRKWYGNQLSVLNFESSGRELRASSKASLTGSDNYFKENITYSRITSARTAFRYTAQGSIPNMAGLALYPNQNILYILGWLNTNIVSEILSIINPTINFPPGTIGKLPARIADDSISTVEVIVNDSIRLSKDDWDSFEASWDFHIHPLVKNSLSSTFGNTHHLTNYILMKNVYRTWQKECNERFNQLKSNEEELNRIFIDIYGLQDELTPEVEDKDVTVRKADLQRDIRSFISYAVGCMMGRYSLDIEGLAFAGGEYDELKYTTFKPDKDAIIPICDDYYFDDDIVGRFIEFVKVVYGEETLEENLQFIADALGGKGTAREILRKYFIKDFYKDHLNVYQKRPIYWLFSSGKKNGFKALIYMHRYEKDMLAKMRTDYVHEQQERYRTQLQLLEEQAEKATPSERVKINKQINKLKDQSLEIQQYEEKIHHLADQMIEIDLDDGVKVNYAKFQDVLEKLK